MNGETITSLGDTDYTPDCEKLLRYIRLDSREWGFWFEKTSRTEACPAGTYKVVLVVDPYTGAAGDGCGYHWYRQNPDGTWSHKNGKSPVRNSDYSGNAIFDPMDSNRVVSAESGALNYTIVVGYFAVTPVDPQVVMQASAISMDCTPVCCDDTENA